MWIIIVVIVVGGIWWWLSAKTQSGAPAVTAPASNATSSSYPQGSSDQSINQDMTDLNAQMNGLSSDNASVTQSMNDQPVQQAQ